MGISYLHLSCCFRFSFASHPCFSAQVSNYLCNIIKILLIHKQMRRRERTQLGSKKGEGLHIAVAFQHFINAKCCCTCCCCFLCIIHKKCHKCRQSNNISTQSNLTSPLQVRICHSTLHPCPTCPSLPIGPHPKAALSIGLVTLSILHVEHVSLLVLSCCCCCCTCCWQWVFLARL